MRCFTQQRSDRGHNNPNLMGAGMLTAGFARTRRQLDGNPLFLSYRWGHNCARLFCSHCASPLRRSPLSMRPGKRDRRCRPWENRSPVAVGSAVRALRPSAKGIKNAPAPWGERRQGYRRIGGHSTRLYRRLSPPPRSGPVSNVTGFNIFSVSGFKRCDRGHRQRRQASNNLSHSRNAKSIQGWRTICARSLP